MNGKNFKTGFFIATGVMTSAVLFSVVVSLPAMIIAAKKEA